MEPPSGCVSPAVSPRSPAGDGDVPLGTAAAAEPAPGWGCSPQKRGRRCPPRGHCGRCPRRGAVPSRDPSGDNGTGGQGTPGALWGCPKAPQDTPRHISGTGERAEETPGDTSGRMVTVPGTGRGTGHTGERLGMGAGGGWGTPGVHPEPFTVPGRRTGHPRGAPSGRGAGQSTPGPHPEPVIATGRRMEHPGGASPALREGWGTLRLQLRSWEQDRAPRGCTQRPSCHWEKDRAPWGYTSVPRRRMWHPGNAPRSHHCHRERDRASRGYIPGDRRRTGHSGGAPRAHLHHWEKDEAPQGCMSVSGRRMWHARDAPRAHHCHWEKDVTPWGCISGAGKRMWPLGKHPEPIISTGRRMWHPGGASLGPGGWSTQGVHRWGREKDGAPGEAPTVHHQHREDVAPWRYILGARRRMEHPEGASLRPGKGRDTPRKHPEPFSRA